MDPDFRQYVVDELLGLKKYLSGPAPAWKLYKGKRECDNCYNQAIIRDEKTYKCWGCLSTDQITAMVQQLHAVQSLGKTLETLEEKLHTELQKRVSLADAYLKLGLEQEFANAIAYGNALPNEVLDLWESKWREQYELEDPLIQGVLDGRVTASDAEWLNSVRSDHKDLVMACLDESLSISWSKSLLEAGFAGHHEAVSGVLAGADPAIAARICGISVDSEVLPPMREGLHIEEQDAKQD